MEEGQIDYKPKEEEDEELIISEPEQFQFQKQEGFSHALCVQKAYYKCEDLLDVEMIEGFWQEVKDKTGNTKFIHQSDTRLVAIESIKTLKNVMIADLHGTIYLKKIIKLIKKIKDIRKICLDEQISWWDNLDYDNQQAYQRKDLTFNPHHFHDKSPHWHDFLNKKIDLYRRIFEQLELCLANTRYLNKAKKRNLPTNEDG